ncbi:hypothetical protein K4A83_06025 [Spirulina subsalsa FACHB-351]|uniref:Uncharacterized protein n=1 Tax=Spirulina subsalsa FACHB-351 TaxID=234711 RepID=A0ABT3L4C2_9CYAN|nr:hypothetical protein [Spirulina subsalsa]MCW6035830.1 hypothetical protein [Spirulina subsalsa FACHB-351]
MMFPQKSDVDNLNGERRESLKAGFLGAVSFSAMAVGIALLHSFWFGALVWDLTWLVKGAIALLSGFLFGVTYRYIIRTDQNSHLKDGAVLAFGLVRAGAGIEIEARFTDSFALFIVLGVESVFCFLIARLALDLALNQQWLKPFKS